MAKILFTSEDGWTDKILEAAKRAGVDLDKGIEFPDKDFAKVTGDLMKLAEANGQKVTWNKTAGK